MSNLLKLSSNSGKGSPSPGRAIVSRYWSNVRVIQINHIWLNQIPGLLWRYPIQSCHTPDWPPLTRYKTGTKLLVVMLGLSEKAKGRVKRTLANGNIFKELQSSTVLYCTWNTCVGLEEMPLAERVEEPSMWSRMCAEREGGCAWVRTSNRERAEMKKIRSGVK